MSGDVHMDVHGRSQPFTFDANNAAHALVTQRNISRLEFVTGHIGCPEKVVRPEPSCAVLQNLPSPYFRSKKQVNMNIEQTWKSVLEQLQTDMPRASFDTWVRDTQALSYADNVLVVAVRNAYARDWLESRLADTVNHLLAGARVSFVVAQEDAESVEVETDSSLQDDKQLDDDSALEVSPDAYDSAYEHIVRPDRAVYLPGYFKRWLRSIGPDLGWMYVSFRQAAYRHGGRNDQFTNRFSAAELAKRAGITERTFWNRSANPATWEKLTGLVTRMEEDAKWDTTSATPKQLPRKFTVAMTMPLTPTDAASLRNWLVNNTEKYGGAEGALRAAVSASVDELIPHEAQAQVQPVTIRQLVRDLFGEELEAKLLDALASAIQNNIMPSTDQIKITVYFMENILAHLGAGSGWVLTLLRDRCFASENETRNRVVVNGGYAEIASWLGITRVKTVWEWLTQKKGGKYINPVFRLYVRESANERDFENHSRIFYVLLEEIASEMLEAFATGKGLVAELLDDGANFSHEMAQFTNDAAFHIGMAEFSVSDGAIFSHDMAQFSAHLGANFSLGMAQFSVPLGANCTVKSSLTLKPNSQTPKPNSITPQPSPEPKSVPAASKSGGMGNMAFWDFDFLTSNNSVNPGSKINLLKSNKKFGRSISDLSTGFVSWLLYAYAPAGSKVSDPIGLAIKRLCENVNAGAGGDFNRLAKLNPYTLKSLFDADMANMDLGESLEAGIYELNFHDLQTIHKHELYRRLFGSLEDD